MIESTESTHRYHWKTISLVNLLFSSHIEVPDVLVKKKCIKTESVSMKDLSGILQGIALNPFSDGGGTDIFTGLSLPVL